MRTLYPTLLGSVISDGHVAEMSSITKVYLEHFAKSFDILQMAKDGKITSGEADEKIRELNKGIIIPYKP